MSRGVLAGHVFLLRIAAALLIAIATSAGADTRIVEPGTRTIHDAMAASAPGDSVVLLPGLYLLQGGVNVHSGVILTSTDGPLVTILDMQGNSRGLVLDNLQVAPVISGLGFVHAVTPAWDVGGAILSINSSPEIRNCFFAGNWSLTFEGLGGHGSAIAILGGAPLIERNTIVGNISGGGAVFLAETGGAVRKNLIAYNMRAQKSDVGFGITCENNRAEISDNLFWANLPTDIHSSCQAGPSNIVAVDPLLCQPVTYPFDGYDGDWRVLASSPVAPGGSLFGIGAFLGLCPGTSAIESTWGRVKSRYRK